MEESYSAANAKMGKYFMIFKNANIDSNFLRTDAVWFDDHIGGVGFVITDDELYFLATRCCKLGLKPLWMLRSKLCFKDLHLLEI